jgi:hypothetical protein
MDSPHKPLFWVWVLISFLAYIGGAVYLGSSLEGRNAAIALGVYIGTFLLLAFLYATPARRTFERPGIRSNLALILVFAAPTVILHIWLAFILENRAAPAVWLAPFMGLGTGLNIRTLLGKEK